MSKYGELRARNIYILDSENIFLSDKQYFRSMTIKLYLHINTIVI